MKLLNINYSDYAGGSAIACSRLHNAFLKNNLDSWLAICKSNYKNKNTLTFSQKKNETKYLFKKNIVTPELYEILKQFKPYNVESYV